MEMGLAGLQYVLVRSKIYAPTGNGIPVIQLSTSEPATLLIPSRYIKEHDVRNATQLIYRSRMSRVELWWKELSWGFYEIIR
jgi:hypothetical protein